MMLDELPKLPFRHPFDAAFGVFVVEGIVIGYVGLNREDRF
jgi:hypothetical protein